MTATQSVLIDNTAEFERFMHPPYATFMDFQRDLSTFQHETATSFFIWSSRTAASWFKASGEMLPPHCPYKYAKYTCVHARRRKKCTKFVNYNCPASFVLHAREGKFEIENASLLHSHTFHLGQPSIYPKNRRLSDEQEQAVLSLIRAGSGSTRVIQKFISDRFGRQLNRSDLHRMVQRHLNKSGEEQVPRRRFITRGSHTTDSPSDTEEGTFDIVRKSEAPEVPDPNSSEELGVEGLDVYDDEEQESSAHSSATEDAIVRVSSAQEGCPKIVKTRVEHQFLNDEQMFVIRNLLCIGSDERVRCWSLRSDGRLTKLIDVPVSIKADTTSTKNG